MRIRGDFFISEASCPGQRRWRMVWVRYWESQGISEEQQMEWAAEERAREAEQD